MSEENRDEQGRFLPGTTGNPNGRPRFSIVSIFKEKLRDIPAGEQREVVEAWAEEYIAQARKENDGVAFRDAMDRFDGKPKQQIAISSEKDDEWLRIFKDLNGSTEPETEGDPDIRPEGTPLANDT